LQGDITVQLECRFTFIGVLQSNKIKHIVSIAHEIQSVAQEHHALAIAKHAKALGRIPFPIYLLVNAGDEATKFGLSLPEVPAFAASLAIKAPELDIQGIMAIPPPLNLPQVSTQELSLLQVPELYLQLRSIASSVGRGRLSLGMSDDLELAIKAGSDCVRIGTSIFGPRQRDGANG